MRIYDTSLKGNEMVSIEPFYLPEDINVRERAITTFEITPNVVGEFPFRYDQHVITGTLVVE